MSLPIKPITPAEIKNQINKLPTNRAPGYDLITNEILKHLSHKSILFLTIIYNAMLRLLHFSPIWKFSVIIMIPKPNKPKHIVDPYRSISLLPTCGKLLKKLLLKRQFPIVSEKKKIIPNIQFGFRSYHRTIHQTHRLTDYILSLLETKQYCPGAFLDKAQAFDRVWHDGLLFKFKSFLPVPYYLIVKSYLEERFFAVRPGNSISNYHKIKAGVLRGSFYLYYIIYLPVTFQKLQIPF